MSKVSEYLLTIFIEPNKLVYSKLLRPVSHEEFKAAMLDIFVSIRDLNLENWLIDSTAANFTIQDQKWSVEHLGLLLQQTNLKKVAMVLDKDPMLQIVAESIRTKVYRIFGASKVLEHFETVDQALNFLLPEENIQFVRSTINQEIDKKESKEK